MDGRTLSLVRHGKIVLPDDQRRAIGQIDLPLSPEGERQADQLGHRFAHAALTHVYASDLERSRRTAERIARRSGAQVSVREDLREVAMGDWEGCTFREIAQRDPQGYQARGEDLANFRVPGGESFADCSLRVVAALDEILATTSGHVLIVGHAGVNRLLLCHMLGMPVAHLFRLAQDYGCLNVVQCGAAGFQVKLLNGRARTGRRGSAL